MLSCEIVPTAYPENRRFAFTIYDDTDVATLANVAPVYAALSARGIRITKTAWPHRWLGEGSNFRSSETLEDGPYLAFLQKLAQDGFELGWHNATMETSARAQTLDAFERHREAFGTYPRVHANHAHNQENVYWGEDRLDSAILRTVYRRLNGRPAGHYQGHVPASPYFWGDVCRERIDYVRNLSFHEVNLLRINPTIPYQDPSRPYGKWWFSSTDAEDADAFVARCTPAALDALEAQGGVCIIATHLGKGYTIDGLMRPDVTAVFDDLAKRDGWYVPVGTLLDYLRSTRGGPLPRAERRQMEWRWAADLLRRRLFG